MKHTKDIMESTLIIKKGVAAIPGLKLVGDCEVMIVCFAGDVVPAIDGQSNSMRLPDMNFGCFEPWCGVE